MKLVILITEETLLGKFIFTFLLGILFISFGYFFIKKDNKNFIKIKAANLFIEFVCRFAIKQAI